MNHCRAFSRWVWATPVILRNSAPLSASIDSMISCALRSAGTSTLKPRALTLRSHVKARSRSPVGANALRALCRAISARTSCKQYSPNSRNPSGSSVGSVRLPVFESGMENLRIRALPRASFCCGRPSISQAFSSLAGNPARRQSRAVQRHCSICGGHIPSCFSKRALLIANSNWALCAHTSSPATGSVGIANFKIRHASGSLGRTLSHFGLTSRNGPSVSEATAAMRISASGSSAYLNTPVSVRSSGE